MQLLIFAVPIFFPCLSFYFSDGNSVRIGSHANWTTISTRGHIFFIHETRDASSPWAFRVSHSFFCLVGGGLVTPELFNSACNSVHHSLPSFFGTTHYDTMWCCVEINCVISVLNIHYERQAMIQWESFLHQWFDSMGQHLMICRFVAVDFNLQHPVSKNMPDPNYYRKSLDADDDVGDALQSNEKKTVVRPVASAICNYLKMD